MAGTAAGNIERGVAIGAAVALAGAGGFAVVELTASWAAGVAGAAALLLGTWRLLDGMGDDRPLTLAAFEPAALSVDDDEPDELILSDTDRLAPPGGSELPGNNIPPEPELDSRVVRLFDPASGPTAGQLQAAIDHHLRGAGSPPVLPDDSRALHHALAELRRSLR